MSGFWIVAITAYSSLIVFNFLFYKLNKRLKLFNSIQIKINALGEKKRKLKKKYTLLIFIIILILPVFRFIDVVTGLVIGFLFAFQDICFSTNPIENDWVDKSQ